jgi:hypothetical protein
MLASSSNIGTQSLAKNAGQKKHFLDPSRHRRKQGVYPRDIQKGSQRQFPATHAERELLRCNNGQCAPKAKMSHSCKLNVDIDQFIMS